ncbi:MAG: hypothetical protein ACRDLQ_02325 [Solirubrobacterales bacterium]
MRGLERFAPLTGVAFVILVIVAVIVGGETPAADDPLAEVVEYWNDNKDQNIVAAIIAAISTVFLLWFAGVLRAVLAAAEGAPARLANTAFGGAVIGAVGWAMLIGFTFVAADTAGEVAPQVTQTLSALQADFFFPLSIGFAVFLLASGLAIVRAGALPSWVGWVALVLGVVALTPAGFFAILAMLVWIVAVSVMLFMATTPPSPTRSVPGEV